MGCDPNTLGNVCSSISDSGRCLKIAKTSSRHIERGSEGLVESVSSEMGAASSISPRDESKLESTNLVLLGLTP